MTLILLSKSADQVDGNGVSVRSRLYFEIGRVEFWYPSLGTDNAWSQSLPRSVNNRHLIKID